jgi:hypothetical protein
VWSEIRDHVDDAGFEGSFVNLFRRQAHRRRTRLDSPGAQSRISRPPRV